MALGGGGTIESRTDQHGQVRQKVTEEAVGQSETVECKISQGSDGKSFITALHRINFGPELAREEAAAISRDFLVQHHRLLSDAFYKAN